MSSLYRSYLRLEEASAEPEVADKVKHLVTGTFVRETELKVAEVTVFADFECRYVEEIRHLLDLFFCHRVLDYHDGVVDITSLDQAVVEKKFDLVEEYECPACADLFRM